MLTDAEVNHIAKLARIDVDDRTREKMKKDLSSILDYIAVLTSVPTDNVQPLFQVTGLTNVLRRDEYRGDFPADAEQSERLVGAAPHREGALVKVRIVRKKESNT